MISHRPVIAKGWCSLSQQAFFLDESQRRFVPYGVRTVQYWILSLEERHAPDCLCKCICHYWRQRIKKQDIYNCFLIIKKEHKRVCCVRFMSDRYLCFSMSKTTTKCSSLLGTRTGPKIGPKQTFLIIPHLYKATLLIVTSVSLLDRSGVEKSKY
jgi:hypothetical protein